MQIHTEFIYKLKKKQEGRSNVKLNLLHAMLHPLFIRYRAHKIKIIIFSIQQIQKNTIPALYI